MSQQDRIKRAAQMRPKSPQAASPLPKASDARKVYGGADAVGTSRAQREGKAAGGAKSELSSKARGSRKRYLRDRFFQSNGGARRESETLFSTHRRLFWTILGGVAALLLIGLLFLENRNLSVDEQTVTIVGLPAELENYRILHLSDLNGRRFGDRQSTLLRTINALNYDVIFMTGDMIGPGGDPRPFYELLDGLPSRKKVYFIAGDSDPSPFAEAARGESGKLSELVLADWVLGAEARGATYVDVPMKITVGTASFWLTPTSLLNLNLNDAVSIWREQTEQEQNGVVSGIAADYGSLPFTSYRYEIMQKALESALAMQQTDLHISLSHVPPSEAFIRAADAHDAELDNYLIQPELILAGHYCGGVWRLPLLGAFYIPNSAAPRYGWFPAKEDVSGLSDIDETQMYISAGLSICSDAPLMRFRLLNRPQVSIITLTATLPTSMLDN